MTRPRVSFHAWTSAADFEAGTGEGIRVIPGDRRGIEISWPAGPDRNGWSWSRWTAPVHTLDFGATRLVASWNAQVPPGTWLKTEMRARLRDATTTRWLDLAHYAFADTDIGRSSVSPAARPYGAVDTDTFVTSPGRAVQAYQLRVTLYRRPGTSASPRVWQLAASASAIPPRTEVPASRPGPASAKGVALSVPGYSQNVHRDGCSRYGGGGGAWCSPASAQMVCEYWGARPSPDDMSWVHPGCPDPSVDYAARHTYDHLYRGTGNWPFNAAYASHFGLDAEVVWLPSLAALEELLARGIPVVTSQAFGAGEIAGAGYRSAGHLWVVTGFTVAGDVLVNDPAAPSNSEVGRVFSRREFENVWLRTRWMGPGGLVGRGSGGVAYIIKPHAMKLPPCPDPANPAW